MRKNARHLTNPLGAGRGEKITVKLITKLAKELNRNIKEFREKNKNPRKSQN